MRITIILLLFISAANVFAQDSTLHPYIGASLNLGGAVDQVAGEARIGWGVEAGLQYRVAYFGIEYGMYGVDPSTLPVDAIGPNGKYIPGDGATSREEYFGGDVGFILNDRIRLGVVLLWSDQKYNHYVPDAGDTTHTKYEVQVLSYTWFNIGPDLRFQLSPNWLLAISYTVRRGLKLGAAYMF
ncbi:MAG TPA: hypothetical protein VEW28_03585 [Candidatus Kapabacteria bacterium]|nr:hypothetical protein [Candidatus Kapabacteria bacterium]